MWLGYCNLLGLKLLLRPQQRNGGIVMNVYYISVCLSVCLSVRSRISEITIQSAPNFLCLRPMFTVWPVNTGSVHGTLDNQLCYRRRTARRAVPVKILSILETSCTTNPQQVEVSRMELQL